MKLTNAYAAKRALFAKMAELAAGSGELSPLRQKYGDGPVQVSYDYPARDLARECVYGGGVRFTQTEAAHDGNVPLILETVMVGIVIRINGTGAPSAQFTDQRAEEIADFYAEFLAANPDLGAGFTFSEVTTGQGDYFPTDEERTSILGFQIGVWSYLS